MKLKNPIQIDEISSTAVIIIFIIILGFFLSWVWSIYLLIKHWKEIPDVIKVIGVLGVFQVIPLGHILTIVLVLIYRKQ